MSPTEPVAEKYITLPQGRTLAYTTSGNPSSPSFFIFFHGAFGVGRTSAKDQSKVLLARDVHFAAPTLPGWGKSSPRPKDTPYHVALAQDTTALIDELYPNGPSPGFRIYVSGASYGTVAAQMLYGAPFDLFPYGKYIVGCFLLAPFSPFKYHIGYAKTLSTSSYISVGPPTRWIPFNILPRLSAASLASKVGNETSAEKFVRNILFDKMGENEKKEFTEWREKYGKAKGELEKQFAVNMVDSVAETKEGFIEVSDVIHSDWGFDPARLDEEHNKRLVFISSSTGDEMASDGMAKWLDEAYKNSYWESLEGGGHISGMFRLDEAWSKFLDLTDQLPSAL